MSSFTRTIPAYKSRQEVEQVLSNPGNYVPLTFQPKRAQPGDFIYLIYHASLLARARIAALEPVTPSLRTSPVPPPPWAKWLVRITGDWQFPPRPIPVQGHQGVRYLDQGALACLDAESWSASRRTAFCRF
jgi:hypothetical protein